MATFDGVWSVFKWFISRGKVTRGAAGSQRTALQVTGLAGEIYNNVALLLPYGMTAIPQSGDVLILPINGSRDHKVALCADNPALRISGLESGEFGFRNTGIQIVLRIDGQIQIQADGETLRQLVTDQFMALFNGHTHSSIWGDTGVPEQQMTSAQLTGALHAGGQS